MYICMFYRGISDEITTMRRTSGAISQHSGWFCRFSLIPHVFLHSQLAKAGLLRTLVRVGERRNFLSKLRVSYYVNLISYDKISKNFIAHRHDFIYGWAGITCCFNRKQVYLKLFHRQTHLFSGCPVEKDQSQDHWNNSSNFFSL